MYAAFDWGDDWSDGADLGMFRFRPKVGALDAVIWQGTYDGPDFHMADYPVAMAVDAAGNAIAGWQTKTTPDGMD